MPLCFEQTFLDRRTSRLRLSNAGTAVVGICSARAILAAGSMRWPVIVNALQKKEEELT